MAEVSESTSPTELLATGRRHLAVRDYNASVEALAKACELLAQEHGDLADQCAEPYLWYGKALLGLSRDERGVLGDGVPGNNGEEDDDDDDEQDEENGENGEKEENGKAKNGEAEAKTQGEETTKAQADEQKNGEKCEAEPSEEPSSSKPEDEETEATNGEGLDESTVNMEQEGEDEVDNLQLAWEMLDLSRSILYRRVQDGGGDGARALLADTHLALGEVALESETYDKAVVDMQSCLDLQKELYPSDDRRIAETHYQIGLANSLASNFEDAITHFKNAANILNSRIKTLENPTAASEDASVKKHSTNNAFYTVEGEIKELKELLPEIQEKIQDMMDYKAETLKRVRETLLPSNGAGPSSSSTSQQSEPGFCSSSSSSSSSKPAASDISHLIKRKRKSSEGEATPAKRANT